MRIFTLSIACLCTLGMFAQTKIDNRLLTEVNTQKTLRVQGVETPAITVFVTLNGGTTAADLMKAGFDVETDLGEVAIVSLPIDALENLEAIDGVRSIERNNLLKPNLNLARAFSGVDALHQGIDTREGTATFTGRGVILGVMDTGFDPNHPNFIDANGKSRVARFWYMGSNNGTYTEYADDNVSNFTTDTRYQSHATHVSGIMGGRYYGTGNYIAWNDADGMNNMQGYTGTENNPYYGVATDGVYAMAGGELYNANVIQGVTNIIEYAEMLGKPAVVNLSMGSDIGPHDGTDALNRALDELGKRAIICVASSNSADCNSALHQKFTEESATLQTITTTPSNTTGEIDIWTANSNPVTVTLYALDKNDNIYTLGTISSGSGRISNSSYIQRGQIQYSSGVASYNNRYNTYIYMSDLTMKSGYTLFIKIEGKDGDEVWVYGDGTLQFTDTYNGSRYKDMAIGTPDGVFNDMVCGYNTISVGAYTTQPIFPAIGNNAYTVTNDKVGDIAYFSSYGTTFDGRDMPHVCAPGSIVISSYNSYEGNPGQASAQATVNSRNYYWAYMAGTSMATPFVAGSVALMLQADPTLTVDDVRDILMNSASNDSFTAAAPKQFGAGKVNTLEAVRTVLNNLSSGVRNTELDNRLMINHSGSMLEVIAGGDAEMQVALISLDGKTVARTNGSNNVTLNVDGLQGVYVVTVTTPSGTVSRKIALF